MLPALSQQLVIDVHALLLPAEHHARDAARLRVAAPRVVVATGISAQVLPGAQHRPLDALDHAHAALERDLGAAYAPAQPVMFATDVPSASPSASPVHSMSMARVAVSTAGRPVDVPVTLLCTPPAVRKLPRTLLSEDEGKPAVSVTLVLRNSVGTENLGGCLTAADALVPLTTVDAGDVISAAASFLAVPELSQLQRLRPPRVIVALSKIPRPAGSPCTTPMLRVLELSGCDGIAVIGTECCAGCTSLERVVVTENCGLRRIGARAFYNCTSLVTFDLSLCKRLENIDVLAFGNCTRFVRPQLHEGGRGVDFISDDAFSGCPRA